MALLFALVLSACSGGNQTSEDTGKTDAPGETEVLSVKEVRLTELQSGKDYCVAGYNDSGHGIVFYLYYLYDDPNHSATSVGSGAETQTPPRAEYFRYYLVRYETDLLTEAFWNDEPVTVHLCHKGEINGMDWDALWARFYTLRGDSKELPSSEQWNPDESVGFWGTECERPMIVQLKDCSKDYQKAEKPHKDQGILALLQAEYKILGTKKQLMTGVTPSKK